MFSFGRSEECSSNQSSTNSGRISSTSKFTSRKNSHSSNSSSSQYDFGSDSGSDTTEKRRHKTSGNGQSNYYVNKQPCDGLVKLLMIGEASVGKSSLVQRYVDDDFQYNWIATIGIDIRLKLVQAHGKNIKVQIWDSAGQERFRAITRRHFHGIHGVCIVFDVTDKETFDRLPYWINMANNALDYDIPRVIVGNKIDLEGKRKISFEEASEFCRSEGITYVEASAMTGENVQSAYFDLISEAFKEQGKYEKDQTTHLVKVVQTKPSRKNPCC